MPLSPQCASICCLALNEFATHVLQRSYRISTSWKQPSSLTTETPERLIIHLLSHVPRHFQLLLDCTTLEQLPVPGLHLRLRTTSTQNLVSLVEVASLSQQPTADKVPSIHSRRQGRYRKSQVCQPTCDKSRLLTTSSRSQPQNQQSVNA